MQGWKKRLPVDASQAFHEAVHMIGTAARSTVPTALRGRIVLVTSSLPQEGKTTTAIAIAREFAASGLKTLVIDADLRHPGASQHLKDGGSAEATGNLHVITASDLIWGHNSAENPQALLMSSDMKSLIERARIAFDVIVCDSPPVMVVSDATILARLCDLIIFVVRWGHTPAGMVVSGIEQLRRTGCETPCATVLGRVDLANYRRYGDDDYIRFQYPEYYAPKTESLRKAAE
jgi:capsular exopolysaccharide synthesis family protein